MDPVIVLERLYYDVALFGMCFSVAGLGLVVLIRFHNHRLDRLESRIEALEKLNIKTV